MDDIINPFSDVPYVPFMPPVSAPTNLINTQELAVGSGSRAFKADRQGIWLGANKFADAPFSVDVDGNMVATSATIGNYLTKAGTNQILTGSILIPDSTTNRIFIGVI